MENNFENIDEITTEEETVEIDAEEIAAIENGEVEFTEPEAEAKVNVKKPKSAVPLWLIPICIAIVLSIAMAIILPQLDIGKPDPVYLDYEITVVDSIGNPFANVMVSFTTPEGEVKTRVTGNDGKAVLQNMLEGEYKVKIERGFSSAVISKSEYTLTKDNPSIVIKARDEKNSFEIYGNLEGVTYASNISAGSFTPFIDANTTSYFVFYATSSGVYKVSVTSDEPSMTVGYYGIPLFVQSTHCGEGEYDGKSFELLIQDYSTPYVIGVSSTNDATANLVIERTGDAPFDPIFEDWTNVESTATLTQCDTTGKTLVDFDIASEDITVSLGDDGYYYTNDGKPVYIRITSTTGHGYVNENHEFVSLLGGSLALLAGHVDDKVGINIGGYVFDEDGEFVGKYLYNGMIKTYMDYVDSKYGVVPLTAELAECIKLHGESNGWWNSNSGGYLFSQVEVNPENAWLFLCMVEQ